MPGRQIVIGRTIYISIHQLLAGLGFA